MLGPWAVPLLFVALCVVFSVAAPDTFATTTNVRVMIVGQATILLLSIAILIPLRAGDFDLSVSAVMVLSACVLGYLTAHGYSAFTACLVALLIGPIIGFVNGMLVVRIGIDSFIATLGTLTILVGLSSLVSGGALMTTVPAELLNFSRLSVLDLTMSVWLGWGIALVVYYVFEWTPAGRYLLFIGNNTEAARLAGLRVNAYRQGMYVVSGTLSALAGLLVAGSLGSIDPTASGAYLLPPITAAFLGASAIKLGRFNVVGTLVAIYLVAVGVTGLQMLGLESWIADVFNGTLLVFAVGLTIFLRRGSSK
ncbi:putative ABC transporter permease protein [Rhodococcus wratislaviensis NBRC 100605]|uniref:Putative ABC transporter permease protein n=1 Tax=Rhodococcus wratislaviensis NBRC 100605 TaxID=1219028 RepID=X0R924_RHOWR|nr:putative ABC transporter permease protein [Rhodococcus wratislaviensis NBRC 100605]